MPSTRHPLIRRLGAAGMALTATLTMSPGPAASNAIDVRSDVALKAAFLYNFARFTKWPALPDNAALRICLAGDDGVAAAVTEIARGQNIGGHALDVRRTEDNAAWAACHELFVSEAETRRSAAVLMQIRELPILTVSDGQDFAQTSGIVQLFVDSGRMRFAINVDTAERSGLHLSSRLLALATVIRNDHLQQP